MGPALEVEDAPNTGLGAPPLDAEAVVKEAALTRPS